MKNRKALKAEAKGLYTKASYYLAWHFARYGRRALALVEQEKGAIDFNRLTREEASNSLDAVISAMLVRGW